MKKIHKYTNEEKDFLREFVPGHSHSEIRNAFEEKFGWEISITQVKASIKRYGLNTGRKGYFSKGHIPHNKGQKMPLDVYEKAKATMFKKGNVSANYRPLGSERVNVDGYVEIKVKDPGTWRLKHVVVWEQHNGKVPKGHVVIFLDRNSLNTDISNLRVVKRSELLIMNRNSLFSEDAQVTETGAKLAKLIDTTNRAGKKGELRMLRCY